MNSALINFFEAMSFRMNNENDLSDITYAMCKSNDDFRKLFLEYCFEESIDTDDLIREYAEEDSRPDFYFIDRENNERLIEVKIYDRNQHFAQYNRQFPNAKYAYISNYKLQKDDLCKADREALASWKLKTWFEFYNKLSESTLIENELIMGYLNYLKRVIDIKEFKNMNLRKISDLPDFNSNLVKIVREKGFAEYNGSKAINEYYYGNFFHKEDIYFWFGLYLPEEKVYIGIKNNENWIPSEIKKYLNENFKIMTETEFFEKPVEASDGNFGDYWFALKNNKYDILCDESLKDKQEEVLAAFFTTVMESIGVKI